VGGQSEKSFLATLEKNGGVTAADAAIVLALYRKMKLVTSSAHDGIQVKHGGFLDRAVIRRALKQAKRIADAKRKP
jgi:hypothetical protein